MPISAIAPTMSSAAAETSAITASPNARFFARDTSLGDKPVLMVLSSLEVVLVTVSKACCAACPAFALSFKASSFLRVRMKPPAIIKAPATTSIISTPDQSPVRIASMKPLRLSTIRVAPEIIKPIPPSWVLPVSRPKPLRNKPRFFTKNNALSQFIPLFTMSLIAETIPESPEITSIAPAILILPNRRNAAPRASAKPLISLVTLVKLGPFAMMS